MEQLWSLFNALDTSLHKSAPAKTVLMSKKTNSQVQQATDLMRLTADFGKSAVILNRIAPI